MLPLVWLAVSPHPLTPIDTTTVLELHLSFATLLWHKEVVDLHVIARAADFKALDYVVLPPSNLTFHDLPRGYVQSTFARAGITGGAHHSKIGGACKLLLPALLNMRSFIFFDTDVVFLRPASNLMDVAARMEKRHLVAAPLLNTHSGNGLGYRHRISSGLMIFNDVNAEQWVNAIIGALLMNPLNCDPFHWGPYVRPMCIRTGQMVGGDQEVISVVVSATYSLYELPKYAHHIEQGDISSVSAKVVTLHYKRRDEAKKILQQRGMLV